MSGLELLLLPIAKVAGAKLAGFLATNYGAAIAGAGMHYAGGKIAPHIAANMSQAALHNLGINYVTGTLAGAAGAATAFGVVYSIASGTWGAYTFVDKLVELRTGRQSDDAAFVRKGPIQSLTGSKTLEGENYNKVRRRLLNEIVTAAFQLLDMVYASEGHEDEKGELKVRIDQMKSCTQEDCDCTDLSGMIEVSVLGRRHVCKGCYHEVSNHVALRFDEHFCEGGPGAQYLKVLAFSLYEGLQRMQTSPHDGKRYKKGHIEDDLRACTSCGCMDFVHQTGSTEAKCYCQHSEGAHTLKWVDLSQTQKFFALLSIIADYVYGSMDHHDIVAVAGGGNDISRLKKRSIFQIDACESADCTDFNFKSYSRFSDWFLSPEEQRNRSDCFCGREWRSHSRISGLL